MDSKGPGGGGRGRGRGRSGIAIQEQPESASLVAALQAVTVLEDLSSACDSDRGRSRGRGRGRGIDAGRGPGPDRVLHDVIADPPSMLDFAAKFEDSPPPSDEVVGGNGSKTASGDDAVAPAAPNEDNLRGQVDDPQHASVTSGRSTTGTTPVEKPVISRIGTKGDPLGMKTNYLWLKLKKNHPGVVEYHVSIQPPVEDVRTRRKLLRTEKADELLGNIKSFDGMILFMPHILPNDVTVFETALMDDANTTFKVSVTYTKVRQMTDCIVFFNILLHRIMRKLEYKEIRRQYYDLNMRVALDQHRLEIWPGTNLTTENQEGGLMICVDSSNRVLRQDTVLDHLKLLKGDPQMKTKFEQFIINKIVITKYNYKCYKIDEVAWDMQPDSTFEHRDKQVSFVDYLSRYAGVKVTDFNQPMLISKLKPRKNDRFVEDEGVRVAALVPECCNITGLTEDQKSNFKVMTDLATSTRLFPAQRVANLEKFIARVLGDNDVEQILGNWGLYIARDVIEVVGRRVDGPNLQFSPRLSLQKAPPDFSREAGQGVYDPVEVKNYVVLCTERDSGKARSFMEVYKQVCVPLGIKMLQMGQIVTLRGMNPTHFSDALRQHCKDASQVHFVVIIMPQQRDDVYSAIKRYCVANVPIPSQCIVSKTLGNEKRLRSIVLKIALQINCKLGGSLWALKMPLKEDIMFVGIDTAHDPLKKDASVLCLVASLNNECTRYFSKSSTSKVHQELADNLSALTADALKEFCKYRGKFPNRIVVFRDGGSLGSFEQMETSEVDQMKKAATELCGDELKAFTYAVVTKRIPQRFFANPVRSKIDNPPPGSVVDSIVTRRHYYDFYVVSQQVRQGTVNPTHFVVLNPDDPIRPDLIQKLAYVTSFMYYNWSGTVRVPAMVQYAHKLSSLLIKHVKATPHRDISNTLYYL